MVSEKISLSGTLVYQHSEKETKSDIGQIVM